MLQWEKLDEVRGFLYEMLGSGVGFEANVVTYNALISGFVRR